MPKRPGRSFIAGLFGTLRLHGLTCRPLGFQRSYILKVTGAKTGDMQSFTSNGACMETTVVNIRNQAFDQYIGRAGWGEDGYFGNPFKLEAGASRGSTLERYKEYFYDRLLTDPEFKRRVHALKGKRLGCFCKPHGCHGDVIAEYLNGF